jgi:hypothetical protein
MKGVHTNEELDKTDLVDVTVVFYSRVSYPTTSATQSTNQEQAKIIEKTAESMMHLHCTWHLFQH